jgi:UDP-glucose 4-epimerase
MKYVITGGAGFIGSHLARRFVQEGNEVVVIDDLSTGTVENVKDLDANPNFTLYPAGILSIRDWDSILAPGDIIIHLAATVGVNKVCINPLETLQNNFEPTLALLKLAREYRCRFFFSSTSEVYGELRSDWFLETDPLVIPGTHCGRSAYVLGKILSEQYCMNYAEQFGVPVIVARFFNTIGINQLSRYGMVVPTFIKQALSNEPITLFGSGHQTRSFCDVTDVVSAINLLINCNKAYGEVFNIGGIEKVTIRELAVHVKTVAGSTSPIVNIPFSLQRANGRDITNRNACIDKIKSFVSWKPGISWTKTVETLVANEKRNISPLMHSV